jgi:hypothetical protein
MPVTLAVTDTVLLTVEPEAGDVMLTTRLPPNCARAGCGAIKLQPTVANRTATRAILLFTFIPINNSGSNNSGSGLDSLSRKPDFVVATRRSELAARLHNVAGNAFRIIAHANRAANRVTPFF